MTDQVITAVLTVILSLIGLIILVITTAFLGYVLPLGQISINRYVMCFTILGIPITIPSCVANMTHLNCLFHIFIIITDLYWESHLGLHTSTILLKKGFVEFFYSHFYFQKKLHTVFCRYILCENSSNFCDLHCCKIRPICNNLVKKMKIGRTIFRSKKCF